MISADRVSLEQPGDEIEKQELISLEKTIERGLRSFLDTAAALREIQEKKLYRFFSPDFESYCKSRWHFNRQHAYRLISACKIFEAELVKLSPQGYNPREKEIRLVSKLGPDERQTVWTRAVDLAAEEKKDLQTKYIRRALTEMGLAPTLPDATMRLNKIAAWVEKLAPEQVQELFHLLKDKVEA